MAYRACFGLFVATLIGCTIRGQNPVFEGQDVRLSILHTSDMHARFIPYRYDPGPVDVALGLDPDIAPTQGIGGAKRLAYLVRREQGVGQRVIYLNSGDFFQGAPLFNFYRGEPEFRLMSQVGVNATVVGNHEFDAGSDRLAETIEQWAGFPLLAANYRFEDDAQLWNNDLRRLTHDSTIINAKGLRIGVIGLGDTDTIVSINEQGNSLGIIPLATVEAAEAAIDVIRRQVDVVVVLSHLGLYNDIELAEQVRFIDVIMGGHLHVALKPPMVVDDPDGRQVVIMHSGAFMKYLGRLDLVVRRPEDAQLAEVYGFEVASHQHRLFPVDGRADEEMDKPGKAAHELEAMKAAARVHEILLDYETGMALELDLSRTVGCLATTPLKRFANNGGDSPLGNLVAEAIMADQRVETDFALTNSGGIRADMQGTVYPSSNPRRCVDAAGNSLSAVSLEELYNILPFENTITTMYLSGREVQELFDYVAWRTSVRGCTTQAQGIAGASVVLSCNGDEHSPHPHADDIRIGGRPLRPHDTYELAANDYIAHGGSGYHVLKRNTTQVDTGIPMRDAVVKYMARAESVPCDDEDEGLPECPGSLRRVGVSDDRVVIRF